MGVQSSHYRLPPLNFLNLIEEDIHHGIGVSGVKGSPKIFHETFGGLLKGKAEFIKTAVKDIALWHAASNELVLERSQNS